MKTLAVSLLLAASAAAMGVACESRVAEVPSVSARLVSVHAAAKDKEGKTAAPAPSAPARVPPKSPPASPGRKPAPPPVLFM